MENPALIPFDCGDEEIGLIIKRALQDLRASTDEILNQANKRINECQQRLAGYNRRLALVEQKFEYMKQSEEVPLITSPAEFPGKIHLCRPLVFRRSSSATPFTNHQQILRNESCPKSISIKNMILRKNGYSFIFPKGKHNEKPPSKRIENQQIFSLIKSIKKKKGILKPEEFYNLKMTLSADNVYSSSAEFTTNSMLIYDSLKTSDSADPFTYKPGMGNLTEFDLPEVLPQLTGISNNAYAKKESLFGISQSDDENEDIFGKVTKRKMDVDLSARSTFYMIDEPVSRRSTRSKLDTKLLPEPSTSSVSVQKLDTVSVEQTLTVIEPVVQLLTSVESPVPVAPPRSIDVTKSPPAISPAIPPPPPAPINILSSIPSPPAPGRADLMQAIRAAGGIKKAGLKKVEVQEDEEKPAKKSSSKVPESTDDLMGSLAKALERRRKGISGKTAKKFDALEKSGKPSTSSSTFSTLRELIPPPSKNDDSGSESGNDEDWK